MKKYSVLKVIINKTCLMNNNFIKLIKKTYKNNVVLLGFATIGV